MLLVVFVAVVVVFLAPASTSLLVDFIVCMCGYVCTFFQ